MAKRRPEITGDDTPLASNPFASLASALPDVAPGPEPEPEVPAKDVSAADHAGDRVLCLDGPIVVRRQKKGQGGKTATFVEGVSRDDAARLLARLKRELGCSGRMDGDALVLGTAAHDRVGTWLREHGARRVKLGN